MLIKCGTNSHYEECRSHRRLPKGLLGRTPFGIGNSNIRNSAVRFALLTLFFALPLLALDPSKTLTQYAHRIWGQEEGLFQPTIYSILQTRDGFLWLGTQDSLIRFDGSHFREFGDPEDPAFHRSLIRALLEDRQGNLWVGSVGGGVAKIASSGAISRFTTKQGLPSDSVFCIDPDSPGAVHAGLWFCTSAGLAHWNGNRFRVYTKSDGLASDEIRATCVAGNGVRWVAGLNFGLSRIVNGHVDIYNNPLLSERDGVTALACAHDGSVWVGTNAGVAHIPGSAVTESAGQGSAQSGPGVIRLLTTRDGLTDNSVSSLLEGPDGSLWIGGNDGISRYRTGRTSVYRTRDGLSHSVVLALDIDREGTLWAGTKDGLDQFADGKVTPYTTNEGLSGNDTGPVLEDESGRLWIGTLSKGLDYFDGARFHSLSTRDGLSNNAVLSLERAASGGLWVGTRNGLNLLENGKVVRVYSRADGLPGSEIRSLFNDAQGVLWAGSDRGLSHFNGTGFEAFQLDPAAPPAGIVALGGSALTRLFISTDRPAFYALRNGSLNPYSPDLPKPVDCYLADRPNRTVWMGTLGSSLLGWRNGAFIHVRVKDGLYDNRIYSILQDDAANFWMASSKGIFRIAKHDLDDFADGNRRFVESIPFSTGQLRFECQSGVQPAAYRTRDGRLWFSTTGGLVVVDPNHLGSNKIPPPVQIVAAIIDGQRSSDVRNLELKPSQENLEIRYAGLTFISPEKASFRYILDGFDKNWTEAGARREAFFTNLPPGHYRFKVLARNADGVWSTRPATLNFTIQPRLHQRIWFFPGLALLLALAIVLGYRIRIRHLKQRFNVVLAERNRIARELHDTLLQGLSGITMQLQALWIKMAPSKEKQFLGEVIKDAGRCSQEARQSLWGLRATVASADSVEFSERLAHTAHQAVASKPIVLSLHLQPVSLRAVPEVEFQLLRIVHEIISNSLSHARASKLDIHLSIENQTLRLVIEDNGVGFDPGAPQRFGHYGLIGIRERASEIGAELSLITSPGAGAKIELSLPLARLSPPTSNAQTGFAHQLN